MKTYTLILRGIDAVVFHPRVAKSAQMLIKKMCKAVPAERLGYLKNGMQDVKSHKYVLFIHWNVLSRLIPHNHTNILEQIDLYNT